jgi:hypothetical protein
VFVPARAEDLTLSFGAGVDSAAQGATLYRNNASRYVALPAGTAGQVLTTGGPAADPLWVNSTSLAPSAGAVILAPSTSVRNVIQPTGDFIALTLRGSVGQTQDLLQIADSTPIVMASFSPAGRLGLGASALATHRLFIQILSATGIGQGIRAAAAQTGNLFETQDSAGATAGFFRILAGGVASGPGAGAGSERFGVGSLTAGTAAAAFGPTASASGNNSVAIGSLSAASNTGNTGAIALGSSAVSSAVGAVALGTSASATNTTSIALGNNSTSAGLSSIAIGSLSNVAAAGNSSIAIGVSSSAPAGSSVAIGNAAVTNSGGVGIAIGAGSQANTQQVMAMAGGVSATAFDWVVGSGSFRISQFYIGKGVTNTAPTSITINGTGGSGTDIAGADLILAGGRGTGAAAGGSIIFRSTVAAGSSATLQALQDKLTMSAAGGLTTWQRSTTQDREVMSAVSTLATTTDASRKGRHIWSIYDTAAREFMRAEASGTAPMMGFFGAAAVVRQVGASTAGIAAITDANAKAAVQALQTALANLGLVTSPA